MVGRGVKRKTLGALLFLLLLGPMIAGCAASRSAIPAECVRPNIFDAPRGNLEPINLVRLRQDPPAVYQLAARDVLGIYIEGVLGTAEEPPPVHFPEDGNIPPAIGFPMPIREDGTLSLPLVPPIEVEGLTLAQAERLIRKAYTEDQQILKPGRDRIIVTLMRPRTYQVLVVREDAATIAPLDRERVFGTTKRGATFAVDLDAYENDVLHALAETGGLPGVDAKNEIIILRGAFDDVSQQEPFISELVADRKVRDEVLGDPDSSQQLQVLRPNANVVRIPLRVGPGQPAAQYSQDDIILATGDIVFIESRDAEVFYTGGLLQGGQHQIPRDYDLDVLGAISLGGGAVGASAGAGTGGAPFRSAGAIGPICPPTRATVIRTTGGKQQLIRINLRTALVDPRQRILIQPNDIVMLEYTPKELAINAVLNMIQLNYFVNNAFQ